MMEVAGQPVQLPVNRDQVLRAGPGAQYSVYRTADPATPYISTQRYENANTPVRIGRWGVDWNAALAVPLIGGWCWFSALPWLRARDADREMIAIRSTRQLRFVAQIAALIAIAVAARLYL